MQTRAEGARAPLKGQRRALPRERAGARLGLLAGY